MLTTIPRTPLADMFLAALLGDHPVGRPRSAARAIRVGDDAGLQCSHLRRHTRSGMVAGRRQCGSRRLVALVREHFGSWLVRGDGPLRRARVPAGSTAAPG